MARPLTPGSFRRQGIMVKARGGFRAWLAQGNFFGGTCRGVRWPGRRQAGRPFSAFGGTGPGAGCKAGKARGVRRRVPPPHVRLSALTLARSVPPPHPGETWSRPGPCRRLTLARPGPGPVRAAASSWRELGQARSVPPPCPGEPWARPGQCRRLTLAGPGPCPVRAAVSPWRTQTPGPSRRQALPGWPGHWPRQGGRLDRRARSP
jgi:hypothetical protein